jgi:alginate O-acetyltransferase complex protein AlgJ
MTTPHGMRWWAVAATTAAALCRPSPAFAGDADRLVVDARLVETIAIPDPKTIVPYRHALVAYVYQVIAVVSGKPAGKRILVARWAIRDAAIVEHIGRLKRGDTYRLELVRFDSTKELATQKLISAGEDVTLPLYYQADAGVDQLRAGLGALAADPTAVVRGADGFLFFRGELRSHSVGPFWGGHAAKAAVSKADPDPLPAILEFAEMCRGRGVELIVVPVPGKLCVYADKLSAGFTAVARPDEAHRKFYDLLEKEGVTVIDLLPELVKLRRSGTAAYCRTDTHWSPAAVRAAAEKIAEHIRGRPFFRKLPFQAQASGIEKAGEPIRGDLAALLNAPPGPSETIDLERVTLNRNGRPETSATSPLVLAGDSHVLVYHDGLLGKHAGLSDHLTGQLAVPVDLIGVQGGGANGPRIALARRKDNLAGKLCVIWCFAARELTESDQGWQRIPVVR